MKFDREFCRTSLMQLKIMRDFLYANRRAYYQEERAFWRRRALFDNWLARHRAEYALRMSVHGTYPLPAHRTHYARGARNENAGSASRSFTNKLTLESRASVQLSIAERFVSKIAAKLTVRLAVFRPRNHAKTAKFRLIETLQIDRLI